MSGIRISRLEKRYGDRTVLHELDLTVQSGEIFALLGPNGSGKTTLFRILSTLIAPDGGHAEVGGSDVVRDPSGVRTKIGVVFQSPSLDKKLTVRENLKYGGALYGLHGEELRSRIKAASAALRLDEKLDEIVETLSGGQQRRAEIAKCLLARPEILLLDEPSTGLDPSARIDLWTVLVRLREEHGMTVVFTSHLMDESAKADRVAILNAGRLIACDSPEQLLQTTGPEILRVATREEERVAKFLNDECALSPQIIDGEVRAATSDAHAIAARVTTALAPVVLSTTVSKPTLEDVFLFQTGCRFHE